MPHEKPYSEWQGDLSLEHCKRIARHMRLGEEYDLETVATIALACKVAKLELTLDLCLKRNRDIFRLQKAKGGDIMSVSLNPFSNDPELSKRVLEYKLEHVKLGFAEKKLTSFALKLSSTVKSDTATTCWLIASILESAGEAEKAARLKKDATLRALVEVSVKKGLPAPPWLQYTIAPFLF